jgi:hypothetical protein
VAATQVSKGETIESNAAAAETRGAGREQLFSPHSAPWLNGLTGRFFEVDPVFLGAAWVKPYERERDDPLYRPLRIYALDPTRGGSKALW